MAKYQFKVYLNNGNSETIIPKQLEKTDLPDMDKFVYNQKTSFNLYKTLSSELGISFTQIQKVTIMRIRKEIEFSIVINNPYLQSILSSLGTKKVHGYGNYLIDAIVIDRNNPNYKEMEKYLFENLEGDYNFFLRNIYTYNNEFAKLLYQYGNSLNGGVYQEEESKNINELENKIKEELSIYKNYRGICLARKKYEDMVSISINFKKNKAKVKNLNTNMTTRNFNNYTLEKEFPSIKKQVEDYNQEYEEYLDEDEYSMMQDDYYHRGY